MTLRILADQNILALDAWQDPEVELVLCDGRTLSSGDVKHADALLVRSITRVDASLLAGSNVRFVGTATSGTDHIDLDYLQQQSIHFTSAAGANAEAVADYVMCCLAELVVESGFTLAHKTVAVVGAGYVGSALLRRLRATQAKCMACDPFQQLCSDVPYVSFEEALKADVICLHTPLTQTGDYPTWHMLNADNLMRLPKGVVVINAGRGEAIDNNALVTHLKSMSVKTENNQNGAATHRPSQRFILDVWEGEPSPDPELLDLAYLATPHIAGYSVEAKYAASQRVVSSLCEHFGLALPDFQVPDSAPVYGVGDADDKQGVTDIGCVSDNDVSDPCASTGRQAAMNAEQQQARQLLKTFSPGRVDIAFRQAYLAADNKSSGAECFDNIRRSLMARRENPHSQ